jgi:hypothetical protein
MGATVHSPFCLNFAYGFVVFPFYFCFQRCWCQNENQVAENARNLVIVAGHSVLISGHLVDADHDEKDWYLLPYQMNRGLPEAIVAHIKAGIQACIVDPEALLVFSGGETRDKTGPETEGMSYYRVADAMNLWTDPSFQVRARAAIEEFATDSFQNL